MSATLHGASMKDATQPTSFRRALALVNWYPLVLGLIALIATATIWRLATPTHRPFYIFDASISGLKKAETFTVPVQVGVSLALAILQLAFADFVVMAGVRSRALQGVHFMQAFFHLWGVFWFTSFTQQLFAVAVGRQRPSFLAECEPAMDAFDADNLPFFTPNSNFRAYAVDRSSCRRDGSDTLDDASKSFFSGHASSSAVLGVFAALHLLYTIGARAPPRWRNGAASTGQVVCHELKRGAVFLFTNAQLLWVLAVGASRFVDNKHHVDDVIFGLFVGAMYAVFGLADLWAVERDVMSRLTAASADRFDIESGGPSGLPA